jgi:predicted dithiol-disulfide oxidoreductase (DUF899 family)
VAAQRRTLPPGGAIPEDYSFESAVGDGGEVSFSELFEPGKDTLVIYSFMFPRWSGDTRPGPASGETARLPLAETPCASCTSILDSLDGAAPHLARRINLAVVAKSDPQRIRTFAGERGWRNLRLLSSRNNAYNRDYQAETPEGEQRPVLNVFVRDGEGIRHAWASELMFAPRGGHGAAPRGPDLADLERARHDPPGAEGRGALPRPGLAIAEATREHREPRSARPWEHPEETRPLPLAAAA